MAMPTKEEVIEAIRPVSDPEINISIVELGLVYDVELDEESKQVNIKMTLTSPACPVGPQIMAAVHGKCLELPEVDNVDIQLIWSPPWDPRTMASEDVKMMLGIWE
ncbi:MAG TPA: metal-sulfur cluster assembly factor [Acidobacteriota bacterium]